MSFNDEILREAQKLVNFKMLNANDIPKIDLYMEQIISFLESEMGDSLRRKNESVFTSTMINNYAKVGVLPRPENKKYNRRHILTLIYIFMLKQNLSIPDIKAFTSLIESDEQLDKMYDIFHSLVSDFAEPYIGAISGSLKIIDEKLEKEDIENQENIKALTFISLMSFSAMICTMLCGKLLDADECNLILKKTENAGQTLNENPSECEDKKDKDKRKSKNKKDK